MTYSGGLGQKCMNECSAVWGGNAARASAGVTHRRDQIKKTKRKYGGVRKLKKHQQQRCSQAGAPGGWGRRAQDGGVAASLYDGVCAHAQRGLCIRTRTI